MRSHIDALHLYSFSYYWAAFNGRPFCYCAITIKCAGRRLGAMFSP
jgi:hypothetical protein